MRKEQLEQFLGLAHWSVVDSMKQIDENGKGILYIVDAQRQLCGSVTDGDIRRWIIRTGSLVGKISDIMNPSPIFISWGNRMRAMDVMRDGHIHSIPVVDGENVVLDIMFDTHGEVEEGGDVSKPLAHVPTVIMAGGKGTRLYPYTKILPKPLIPIGDIPIMERIIEKFRGFGIDIFTVTVNYRKSMIKSYFADVASNYQIQYVEEKEPLGTAGSLTLLPEAFSMPFFVTNCDILVTADYADIYQHHINSGNGVTIVTALKNIQVPYGVLHARENGVVMSMEEKPKLSYFVNTGMYVLSPEAVDDVPENTFFHMTDLAGRLMEKGKQVGMYPISEDSFLDMGEFEEMRRMEEKLNLTSSGKPSAF